MSGNIIIEMVKAPNLSYIFCSNYNICFIVIYFFISFSQFFNSTTKHTDKKEHYEKSDPSIHTFWTILVCLMSAFIFIVCFCFCRINPNAPHSNASDRKKKNREGAYDVKVEKFMHSKAFKF